MAMDDTSRATVLALVKARLNRMANDTTLDTYLNARIKAAENELAKKGIDLLAESVEDQVFLTDIVVWQYQNRDASGAMPDWLRLRIRERWLSQPQPVVDETVTTDTEEVTP